MDNLAGGYKAILADVVHFTVPKAEALERMAELEALTKTYGGIAVVKTIQRREKPDYVTFIGSGKLEEIIEATKTTGANVLIINDLLKPGQLFRLEEALEPYKMKVWDRVDLILHIFDRHATSAEAKLEIELARLRHIGPRIYNMGAQLGRQRGGTGTRGGAGEGNTEKMKRHLRERERTILKKLETYESGRAEHRKSRVRAGLKTVALVGYTNAGKTALLNALTKRKELSADKLFATLDTRVGEMYLPDLGSSALLSDTIGFIRDLPPSLIKAFRSTLSEAVHADLILHVIDASDPKLDLKRAVVEEILASLGLKDRSTILVYNKCDLLPKQSKTRPIRSLAPLGMTDGVCVSAITKDGLPTLKEKIAVMLR